VHKEFRLRRLRDGRRRSWREAAGTLLRAATLPYDRRRLEQLARVPHESLRPLAAGLSPAAAAIPSRQPDES
jgi:hypothetical protein